MNTKPLLVVSLLLGLAGGSAWAAGPGGGPGPGPDGRGPQGMQQGARGMHPGHPGVLGDAYRLDNLTADQRKQLDALRDKQRQQFEANRADRQALHDALANGESADKIRPLAEKEGKHVSDMIMHQVEVRDQINAILTDAQRTQLKQLLAEDRAPRDRGGRR